MPETIAAHKLRGFVHDAKGVVLESLPGLIRVRLGGPGSRYRFKGKRKSWLDLGRKSGAVDLNLYMEQAGPGASLLTLTVHMHSCDGAPATDEEFKGHCGQIFIDLRGYLMAQTIDADESA